MTEDTPFPKSTPKPRTRDEIISPSGLLRLTSTGGDTIQLSPKFIVSVCPYVSAPRHSLVLDVTDAEGGGWVVVEPAADVQWAWDMALATKWAVVPAVQQLGVVS